MYNPFGFFVFLQLWMVFHICARICVPDAHLCKWFHHKADGEPVEDLCETFCSSYGLQWINKGISRFPQLPSPNHV